jgi:hypothetical protein
VMEHQELVDLMVIYIPQYQQHQYQFRRHIQQQFI